MARLETETRNCINEFYNNKIKELEKEQEKFKKEFINKCLEEFENNEIVKLIEENFDKLLKKYKDYSLELKCRVQEGSYYGTDFKYYEETKFKKLTEEIESLKNEKRKLIVTLESNIKGSKEYKEAMNKFIKKLEERK